MDAFGALYPLVENSEGVIYFLAGVFMRITVVSMMAPGLGERFVLMRARLAAALAITAITATAIFTDQSPTEFITGPISAATLTGLMLAEGAAGFVLGFAMRIFVFILQIAGSIIAQHLSLSQLFGATITTEAESPYSAILTFSGICIAVMAGVHFHLAGAAITSYEILPYGQFPGVDQTGEWSVMRTGEALRFALQLSAPFVVIGVIYSLALAAASRAMPQLSAAFVGAPAIVLVGMALFAVTAPVMLTSWLDAFGVVAVQGLQYTP